MMASHTYNNLTNVKKDRIGNVSLLQRIAAHEATNYRFCPVQLNIVITNEELIKHDLSAQLCNQLWNDFKQIANDAIVSHRENRCFWIFIDGNDCFGIFHTGQMLNRTGDTDSDIQLRRHNLTCLTNLPVIWYKTGVNRSTGCTHRRTQFVCQWFQYFERIIRTHTATTGNDDFRSSQLWTIRLRYFTGDKSRFARISNSCDNVNGSRTTCCSSIKTCCTDSDHFDCICGLHSGDRVTSVDWTLEGIWRINFRDFRNL